MTELIPNPQPNRYYLQPSNEMYRGVGHYAPPKTRDPKIKAERKRMRRGTLILQEQERGVEVVKKGLSLTSSVQEVSEWADCMSPVGLGTAPYLINGKVMIRFVDLPMLANKYGGAKPGSEEIRERALMSLERSSQLAGYLALGHKRGMSASQERRLKLMTGKEIARGSFLMSVVALADITADPGNYLSNEDVQNMGRDECQDVVQRAGSIGLEIGAIPTLAQVVDVHSPFINEIEKAASDTVYGLFQRAA